jgi:hypothetical protein
VKPEHVIPTVKPVIFIGDGAVLNIAQVRMVDLFFKLTDENKEVASTLDKFAAPTTPNIAIVL